MPFNDVLRKIPRCVTREVYEFEDHGFEIRSFSQLARRYPSRLWSSISLVSSARFADVADKGRRISAHETRERHERRRKLALKFSHLFACLVGRIVFARSRKHREFPPVRSVPDGTSPLDFARGKLGSTLLSVLSVRSAVKLYFGAREATIFSKHGSPRRGSQNGSSFNSP